ncbi:MAG: Ribosome-recycling factor [Chlamydiia bacterium]|nr:Ribosome-recycling factor [Chlamydiia bacterium]
MSVMKETESKMKDALEHFKVELRNLRSGRANPAVLDSVVVEVYGSEMRIKDVAQVSVAEARQLLVTPYDAQTAGPIAKGIEKANLNLQPMVDGGVVRVPVPPLTEEIRKDTVKLGKKKAEDAKIQVRDIRRKSNDLVKKQKSDNEIAEDVQKKLEKQIQDLTDRYCKEVDSLFSEKEKDIMEV